LPLKWLPIDLIKETSKRYDEKSDVWSFGVTCWEVTSYGGLPYENTNIHNLVYLLENGHRLDKPDECPQEMFEIMLKCWSSNKLSRPNFSELVFDIEQMINLTCANPSEIYQQSLIDFSPLVGDQNIIEKEQENDFGNFVQNFFNFLDLGTLN
jgi:serine/threonine protein kinase